MNNIHHFEGFERHIGQKRRNNQSMMMNSIHDHAAAIFNMSPRTQFLRFGDATSAMLLQQPNLGSQPKISAIGGDLWKCDPKYCP